ncbi:cell division initiation protein [Streptomyces sp. NPDC002851]
MDVQKKLDEIVEAVMGARSMPMSASCVVNRADLLAQLDEVRQALPGSLAHAQEVIGAGEHLVEQARQEAERIIDSARAERGSLISDTEVARQSQDEADRILAQARREAEEIRAEADEYVDSKLANFEVVLTKTLGSVGRGREKLLGTGLGLDANGHEHPDYTEAPERSRDPETLRQRVDQYIHVKLGAFEAVLSKTLDAVGRGRQKLHGRVATDDLAHMAADADPSQLTSDADYLADLANRPTAPATPEPPAAPSAPPPLAPVPAQPGYAQQEAYAYQQQGQYGGGYPQDAYAQQDPYGQQDVYGQQDPYAYQQQSGYGYPQQGYQAQGYEQQAYDQQTGGYGDVGQEQQAPGQAPGQQQSAALDETSLFDTSMISAEQLREYEQRHWPSS